MYLPSNFPRDPEILIPWMEELENYFGGDGCGIATIRTGIRKGVLLTAKDSALLVSRTTTPVVWHTRKISCGQKIDELCHPFKTSRGYLVHNGHWQKGAFSSLLLDGQWSDTKIAAHFIYLYGWKKFVKEVNSGVWIHLVKGGAEVCYVSGDLYVEQETGALASGPCKSWGDWGPAKPGTYEVGEKIPIDLKLPTYSYNFNFQKEDRSLYDAIRVDRWNSKK
jgi:hypothetical protein